MVNLRRNDYIWSYVGTFVSAGASAIMLPFVLHYLSEEMYGLWSVFQSIAAITALFDFGFSTTFSRNINYCWCGATELKKTGAVFSKSTEPNFKLMKETMSACRHVFLILAIVAIVCMAIPGTLYICYISRNIVGIDSMVAWAFYVIAVFSNLYFGYYNTFLRGVGDISDANRAIVLSKLLQILLTAVLLMLNCGIVGTGFAYLAYDFFYVILSRQAFLNFHNIGNELAKITLKVPKNDTKNNFLIVWHNAKKEGLVTLANYLANQACTIICPVFLTLSETGKYALAVQLATVLSNVASTLYNANQPVLQSEYISNDTKAMKRTMSLIVVTYVLLYLIGMILLIIIGLPIIRLINPQSIPTVPLMIGVGAYQFVLKLRNCYTSYFSCTNRIPYVRSFIVSSFIGVIMAVVMLNMNWGVWGLVLAQLISQLVFNAWYWAFRTHRELELSLKQMMIYGWSEMLKIAKEFIIK